MSHIVKCRACGIKFNTEAVPWEMPSVNYYYHKNCYEQWVKKQGGLQAKMSDDEWFEALKYYLNHIIKAPIDWKKLTSQWNNLLKQKKTAKGIYFAMKYFYDVANGDKEKSQGGIGIVSYIYQDSCSYWEERFLRDSTILDKIEEQAKEQARMIKNKKTQIQTKKETIKKKIFSLDDIK